MKRSMNVLHMFLRGGEGRVVDEVYEINEVKSDNTEKGYFKRTHLRPRQETVEYEERKYTSVIVSSASWQALSLRCVVKFICSLYLNCSERLFKFNYFKRKSPTFHSCLMIYVLNFIKIP